MGSARRWSALLLAAAVGAMCVGPADAAVSPVPKAWLPTGWADIEAAPGGDGYWMLATNGAVQAFGSAHNLGGAGALLSGESAVSMSANRDGTGYWLFTDRGRVIVRGSVEVFGDASALQLAGPIQDSIATPTGRGYFMVASDGGVFAYGDAVFAGSMGGTRLNRPVESLVPDPDGAGYWLVASDGGVFSFDAAFHGSMATTSLNAPVTAMVPFGGGYVLVGADGGAFVFSDRAFFGSLGSTPPQSPVVAITSRHQGDGYWMMTANGDVSAFGAAPPLGSPVAPTGLCARALVANDQTNAGTGLNDIVLVDTHNGEVSTLVSAVNWTTSTSTENCRSFYVFTPSSFTRFELRNGVASAIAGQVLTRFSSAPSLFKVSHDGSFLWYSDGSQIHVFDITDGSVKTVLRLTGNDNVLSIDMTRAQAIVQVGKTVRLIDMIAGEVLASFSLPATNALAQSVDWSPDGRTLTISVVGPPPLRRSFPTLVADVIRGTAVAVPTPSQVDATTTPRTVLLAYGHAATVYLDSPKVDISDVHARDTRTLTLTKVPSGLNRATAGR